jgi:hypothetical protein
MPPAAFVNTNVRTPMPASDLTPRITCAGV